MGAEAQRSWLHRWARGAGGMRAAERVRMERAMVGDIVAVMCKYGELRMDLVVKCGGPAGARTVKTCLACRMDVL